MSPVTSRDIADAQALYGQLSRVVTTAPLRQMAGGNAAMVKLLDLHDQLAARVTEPSQINGEVLTAALKAAGLAVDDVRGKMAQCPMGARPKPALPQS